MARKDAGFTLIEALTVMAIVTIALTIGMPAFSGTLASYRVATAMHLLSADMAMARSTAVMKRTRVIVCPQTQASRCSGDEDWSRGWLVFADPDGNGQPANEAEILRIGDPGNAAVLSLPSTRAYLRYQSDGRSAATNLTVHVCNGDALAGKVVVNNLGRIRSERMPAPEPCPRS